MYIDKLYTKLFSNKDWDGIETLRAEVRSISQRLFAEMTHYTTSEGAKGIMKEGFRGPIVSMFRNDNDHIRNNANYDMNRMMDNVSKRDERFWNDSSQSPLRNYNVHGGGYRYMYHHGHPKNKYIPETKDVQDTESDDGILTFTHDNKITFPIGYKQISMINGLRRGNVSKSDRQPAYRIVTDTINDNDLKDCYELETMTRSSNIDNSKNKLEIPRGMYKGTKKLKRGYINDYNDFNPNDFNTEDAPTREAVEDIKKKSRFLNSGHGKK